MAYATDLSDEQWERVLELLCEPKRGRPYPEDLRRVVDAMLYIARTADGAAVEALVAASGLGSRPQLVLVDRGVTTGAQQRIARDRGVQVDRVGGDEPQLDDAGHRVFRPIPYAWRVEVAHGLLGRHRRLAKSFENTASSATAWVQISCVALLLRHLDE